jgi:hypothetical protein
MKEHGVQNVNFKGLMAICVQANFNTIITLFGSGDPKFPMENQKWTSLYHWAQSLDQHTKKLICLAFHVHQI